MAKEKPRTKAPAAKAAKAKAPAAKAKAPAAKRKAKAPAAKAHKGYTINANGAVKIAKRITNP